MAFKVYLVFEDGRRDLKDEITDLGECAVAALLLADDVGMKFASTDRERPRRVEIYAGDRLELSVQIIAGGLLKRRGAPKSRSM
jgi:hypothetical protein